MIQVLKGQRERFQFEKKFCTYFYTRLNSNNFREKSILATDTVFEKNELTAFKAKALRF